MSVDAVATWWAQTCRPIDNVPRHDTVELVRRLRDAQDRALGRTAGVLKVPGSDVGDACQTSSTLVELCVQQLERASDRPSRDAARKLRRYLRERGVL